MARQRKQLPLTGHVVRRVYDENGKYIGCICDDMCRDTTPEQVEKIMERCSEIFSDAIARGAVKNPEQFYRKADGT